MEQEILYDYSNIHQFDVDDNYDYTESSRLLLDELSNNKNLTKEECIAIIQDFSVNRPGEDYGGGTCCYNSDCCHDYSSIYFIPVSGDIYVSVKKDKRYVQELETVTYEFCPSCYTDFDIDDLFIKEN